MKRRFGGAVALEADGERGGQARAGGFDGDRVAGSAEMKIDAVRLPD